MKKYIYSIVMLFTFIACNKQENENKDKTMPVISDKGIEAVPQNCQSFQKGSTIHFLYVFTDDKELGAYNIEIHNNFNHHTHSTQAEDCEEEHDEHEHQTFNNPWVYNQDFEIPKGLKTYTPHVDIAIPNDIDVGEYHFMIRLTDRAGWQQLRSVAIRIVE